MPTGFGDRLAALTTTIGALLVAAAFAGDRAGDPAPAVSFPSSRTFIFDYAATVKGLVPRQPTRVWLPVPSSDETQQVRQVNADLPAGASVATEPRFGNRMLSFELPPDHGPSAGFSVTYRVTRNEIAAPLTHCPVPAGAAMCDPISLLQPDAHVAVGDPFDSALLAGKAIPADSRLAAKVLYDVVDDHLQYRKDKPGWGAGDAAWACRSGFGNCTDFHSLFISLARTEKLPAVFQIGFPVDETAGKVAGYHCWAWVKLSDGWSPVDISEANLHPQKRDYYFGRLDPNRVAFSLGRDLNLVPKQAGAPLNFFVFPYVEEGGKPVPQERIKNSLAAS